ncbi:hypothetical protein F5888DRAFT_1799625 [Russula emetica]|nr:hypothetical protein F5888DRAFT_1799625 [Russula emetica]
MSDYESLFGELPILGTLHPSDSPLPLRDDKSSKDSPWDGFESPLSRPDRESRRPPPPTRSALTYFRFEGVNEYLEALVARIGAPLLNGLRFISRTPNLKTNSMKHCDPVGDLMQTVRVQHFYIHESKYWNLKLRWQDEFGRAPRMAPTLQEFIREAVTEVLPVHEEIGKLVVARQLPVTR